VPSTFLALQVQLVVSGERFRDVQYSFVSFLFAVLRLTVLPFVKWDTSPFRAKQLLKVGHVTPSRAQPFVNVG